MEGRRRCTTERLAAAAALIVLLFVCVGAHGPGEERLWRANAVSVSSEHVEKLNVLESRGVRAASLARGWTFFNWAGTFQPDYQVRDVEGFPGQWAVLAKLKAHGGLSLKSEFPFQPASKASFWFYSDEPYAAEGGVPAVSLRLDALRDGGGHNDGQVGASSNIVPIDAFDMRAADGRRLKRLPAGEWALVTVDLEDDVFGRNYMWNRFSFLDNTGEGAAFAIGALDLLFDHENAADVAVPVESDAARIGYSTMDTAPDGRSQKSPVPQPTRQMAQPSPPPSPSPLPPPARRKKKTRAASSRTANEDAGGDVESRHHLGFTPTPAPADFVADVVPGSGSEDTQVGGPPHPGASVSSRSLYDGTNGLGSGVEDVSWDTAAVYPYEGMGDGRSAIQVNAAPYGAFSLQIRGESEMGGEMAAYIDDFDYLSFWLYADGPLMRDETAGLLKKGEQAKSSVYLRFDSEDTRLDAISIPMTNVVPLLQPKRWTHVEFPLRRLMGEGVAGERLNLSRVSFQDMTGVGTRFYLDGISLLSAGPGDDSGELCPSDLFLCQNTGHWVTRSEPYCVFLCEGASVLSTNATSPEFIERRGLRTIYSVYGDKLNDDLAVDWSWDADVNLEYVEATNPCCNRAIAASLEPAGALSIKFKFPLSGSLLQFWILMPLPLYMPNPMSRASEPTLHVRFDATAATDGTTVTLPITHFAPSIGRHPSEWHYVEVDTQELGFQGYAFDRISFVNAMLPAHGLGAASRNIIFVDGLNIIDRRDEGGR